MVHEVICFHVEGKPPATRSRSPWTQDGIKEDMRHLAEEAQRYMKKENVLSFARDVDLGVFLVYKCKSRKQPRDSSNIVGAVANALQGINKMQQSIKNRRLKKRFQSPIVYYDDAQVKTWSLHSFEGDKDEYWITVYKHK